MTPQETKDYIKAFLPARDSRWWSLGFWGGLVTLIVTEFPDLIPDQYERSLVRVGVLLTTLGAKMGWSWAGTPTSTEGPRPFNKPVAEHEDNRAAADAAAVDAGVKP